MTHPLLPIRVARPGDFDEVARLVEVAFHATLGEEVREAERGLWEPERGLVVRDGPDLVAHATAGTRELTVPGAVVPAAHVTGVAVLPTHRRRGLLTRLMRRQLREIRDAGREPVAVLWASEGRIYPRFGYGLAAQQLTVECATAELRLPAPAPVEGRLRLDRPAPGSPSWPGCTTGCASTAPAGRAGTSGGGGTCSTTRPASAAAPPSAGWCCTRVRAVTSTGTRCGVPVGSGTRPGRAG
ncbi:acetyltransferase (GNAT) family protein [Micromonospora olivasterospora]|uniref:Acetyltransferase (GNAT) family protein n=1 Tax=Micromonospora olivasterospora TaxID=1880 RepID=A0A562I605_MICOL|nr:acetyltransferase (GNAT) family protein [Micromonospora olivasterospora]